MRIVPAASPLTVQEQNKFDIPNLNYAGIFSNLPYAVLITDRNGKVSWTNNKLDQLLGYVLHQGTKLFDGSLSVYHSEDSSPVIWENIFMKVIKEKKPLDFHLILVDALGKKKNVSINSQPIYSVNGSLSGIFNIITSQVTDEIEMLIENRTRLLQKVNDEMTRANRELEQFAYVASHDLQEPLRKIKTFLGMLELSLYDHSFAEKYFQKINSSVHRMESLIKDLLNFSRLTYTNEHFQEVDMNEQVKNVLSDFDLLIQDKNATVKIGKLPVVKAIPVQINQLFANLLSNALKFSNKKPRIIISCNTIESLKVFDIPGLKPEKKYHQFSIKDNGIGFEQKYAEKIFTIFQRLNDNHIYNGTGIGLALCKKIVENHEGIINARSEPGHGSVFNFFLPVAE